MTVALESCLERNVGLIAKASPETAARVRRVRARPDVVFSETADGVPGASAGGRALCSGRRPLEEAERLISRIDLTRTACVVVAGFGAGYHVAALARRLKRTGLIIVFEPDVALLRAVLERVDCSEWLAETNIVFLTEADDAAAVAAATRGAEGLLAMGLELLEHPPSKARLGEATGRFYANVTSLMQAVRTTVVTTLVQVRATLRNLTQNVDHYVRRPGIAELAGAAAGEGGTRPAIVVSAGPSLARTIDLLADARVRERFVIVAVQTVLKPLLERGIRPHFVTALDHHEISRRFYEGLSEADVEGVTLIAEPKANPAIFEAFPGRVRVTQDRFLDALIGPELAGEPKGSITAGATVAHLAYYVARHLGCDPVILTGQDLGFTDGQYYAAGAAIHQVWASELNEFRTLEMMEWERIVRGRSHLRKLRDVLGRPVYTDEQMHNYLVQFERDFRADEERGRRVIDATEGGVAKRHTTAMPLAEAIEQFGEAASGTLELPETPAVAPGAASLRRVEERLRAVRRDVWKVGDLSRRAAGKLAQMSEHHADQPRVNDLIQQVHQIRDEVKQLEPAYELVQYLNQSGALNRMRADRALHLDEALSPLERQKRQIERDQDNIARLAECADLLGAMLDEAASAVAGGARRTRDLPGGRNDAAEAAPGGATNSSIREGSADRGAVAAVVLVDFDDDLDRECSAGRSVLQLTLQRLSRCRRVNRIVLVADDAARAERAIGKVVGGTASIHVHRVDLGAWRAWRRGVRAARLWSSACWRGGLGNATVFDEVFEPGTIAAVLEELDLSAALLVGPDWCFVDPTLCHEVILRHLDQPRTHRLTFSQAAPGLAGCVVERSLAGDLARVAARAPGPWGTIGAVLGYNPAAPIPDLIASPVCAAASVAVRDAGMRFIADSPEAHAVLARLGNRAAEAGAEEVVAAAGGAGGMPEYVAEVWASEQATGPHRHPQWMVGAGARGRMGVERAAEVFGGIALTGTGALVTLFGSGDPVDHPELGAVIQAAQRAGVAGVHVRTDLACEPASVEALLEMGADVISVDLLAHTAGTYRALTGRDEFERVRGNLERLLAAREARFAGSAGGSGGLRTPWIVPRITRCDAVYEEVEAFYDEWTMRAGCAVIDPLPVARTGERIAPLPVPGNATARISRRVIVLADGATLEGGRGPSGSAGR